MFELKTPTTVKLKHASARKEHHGDILVLALDLRLVWTTNNRSLDEPFPGLRDALFTALPIGVEDPDDDQAEMDLPVSETPFVRLAKLKYPVKWEEELTGYTVRQDFGLGGKSDKVLNAFDHLPPRLIPADTRFHYRATEDAGGLRWRPSIHMPRWASRITLEVTGVRVEQLHSISDADAIAEGVQWHRSSGVECPAGLAMGPRESYRLLWEQINGAGSWSLNPFVWCISFRRV